MKEKDSKKVLEELKQITSQYDLYNKKGEEYQELLAQLEQEPIIKRYKELLKKIATTESEKKEVESKLNMKKRTYNVIKEKTCNHETYMYEGTYEIKVCQDVTIEVTNKIPKENETSSNKYVCLECGFSRLELYWKDFESRSQVLKSYDIKGEENIKNYHELFINLLLQGYQEKEALSIVKTKFKEESSKLDSKKITR